MSKNFEVDWKVKNYSGHSLIVHELVGWIIVIILNLEIVWFWNYLITRTGAGKLNCFSKFHQVLAKYSKFQLVLASFS